MTIPPTASHTASNRKDVFFRPPAGQTVTSETEAVNAVNNPAVAICAYVYRAATASALGAGAAHATVVAKNNAMHSSGWDAPIRRVIWFWAF